MSPFPYKKLVLVTSLQKEEIYEILSVNTQALHYTVRQLRDPKNLVGKKFVGRVFEHFFSIQKVITYKNAFLPQVEGRVFSGSNFTEIRVTLKPMAHVIAFMSIWFGGLLFAAFAFFISSSEKESGIPMGFLPLIIAIIVYAIIKSEFSSQSKDILNEIMKILKAEIKN